MRTKNQVAILFVILFVASILSGCVSGIYSANNTQETIKDTENDEIQEGLEEEEKEPEIIEEIIAEVEFPRNTLFVKSVKQNIKKEAKKDAETVATLSKGHILQAIDEFIEEKEGDADIEEGIERISWTKVSFKNEEGQDGEGWLLTEDTVKDWKLIIPEKFRDMDFTPQKKVADYHENPRIKARGIYVTIYSAGGQRIDDLIEMSKRTSINTFVIDVKDDSGYMLFETEAAKKYSPSANEKVTVKDIDALMKKLKDNDIYTVARIVSFKDPTYTKHNPDKAIIYKDTGKPFTNSDGLIWVSPHDRNLWDYNIAVSKEAAEVGFNEIQFDYVRFPASDGGKLDKHLDYRNEVEESKPATIQNYLKYAREELSPLRVYISADVYGLVGSVDDDMALGQHWEAVSNIVDYICPMMYPSHYANNTYGIPIPDANPYGTVFHSTKDSVFKNQKLKTPAIVRPWIQDFTASWVKGYIKYGDKQVLDQIKALEDNGVDEFMLWNASNRYSEGGVAK